MRRCFNNLSRRECLSQSSLGWDKRPVLASLAFGSRTSSHYRTLTTSTSQQERSYDSRWFSVLMGAGLIGLVHEDKEIADEDVIVFIEETEKEKEENKVIAERKELFDTALPLKSPRKIEEAKLIRNWKEHAMYAKRLSIDGTQPILTMKAPPSFRRHDHPELLLVYEREYTATIHVQQVADHIIETQEDYDEFYRHMVKDAETLYVPGNMRFDKFVKQPIVYAPNKKGHAFIIQQVARDETGATSVRKMIMTQVGVTYKGRPYVVSLATLWGEKDQLAHCEKVHLKCMQEVMNPILTIDGGIVFSDA